jgi:hypothetical protein
VQGRGRGTSSGQNEKKLKKLVRAATIKTHKPSSKAKTLMLPGQTLFSPITTPA